MPSRTRFALDEEATAQLIAEDVPFPLVLRPLATRWLEVLLVVEDSPSMGLWQETAREWHALLERHGAFWRVQRRELRTDDSGELRLFSRSAHGVRRQVGSREVVDPSGRRLIVLLSDCVSMAWEDGRVGALVREWGRHNPVALIQVLPEHLWHRSGLGVAMPVRLHAPFPAAANLLLRADAEPWPASGEKSRASVLLPALEFSRDSLETWAKMVAGSGTLRVRGVELVAEGQGDGAALSPGVLAEEQPASLTARERVAHFRATASLRARQLAVLFSAANYLSLPVMRQIRQALLPAAELGHMAEVFLGGLLYELGDEGQSDDPEAVRYDFIQGVRELLLDTVDRPSARSVLEEVSKYVSEHLSYKTDFRAILADPTGESVGDVIPEKEYPFARIGAEVLKRLGGEYARMAARLEAQIAKGAGSSSPVVATTVGERGPEHSSRPVVTAKDGRVPDDTRDSRLGRGSLKKSLGQERARARWGNTQRVDVIVLTSLTLEYRAALQVEAGAWDGSHWEKEEGPNGLPVAFRTFRGKGGRPLRVAVAQAGDMGAVSATNALLPLVRKYGPRCVAMSGVCAGRPQKTNLGDVIAAERLFFHDTGKKLPDEVQQDLRTHNLREDWKVALEHFDFAGRFRDEKWWKSRPVPYEWQENWVLAKLNEGVADPSQLPECDERCPQWEKVIESLWRSGDVREGSLSLTDKGRERIERILIKYRNRLPDTSPSGTLLPFKVHIAPMGSGNQVVEDRRIWSFISEHMRKTLGLEMEAAALGALAHAQRDRNLDALVMKGVMDFANHGRDDQFKEFAARASAECLLAFLREHLDVEVRPDVDDLLVSGTEALPDNPPPSALLNARYEVVPFHERGREELLSELDRWCDEGPSVAVRLLHAEGGAGKTRLAIEWTRRRKDRGWAAGFLVQGAPGDWFERLWGLGQPALVVVDYAESRSDLREALIRVVHYAQQEGTGVLRRMRILLLARNDGDWWQSLRRFDTGLGAWIDATPPVLLPPLVRGTVEREQVFHEAAEKFARMRGKVYVKRVSFPLSDVHFERVLYLHMAALASVEGLAFEANTLIEVILDHEERVWEVRAKQEDVERSLQRSLARQMVAAATLRGGLADLSSAFTVAGRLLGRTPSSDEQELLLLLQRIYQRTGAVSDVFLPALEPDLLGEGMVCRVASPMFKGERVPDDWINRVFPYEEEPRVVGTGLEVLGRASATQPSVVRPWIERLLSQSFHQRALLALEVAKAIELRTAFSMLGDILADRLEVDGDAALARELEAAGIPESTVSLLRVAEWTNRTLLDALPASEGEEGLAERARLLKNLGNRLNALGRREASLEATREAVEIYRALANRNPDAFWPYLAMSLNNLGTQLRGLSRREEALEATRESVELYRALANRNPDAFRPDFAMSLNNLGTLLSGLGRREEALAVTREAAELRRELAKRNPEAFRPDLAMSLNNLGTLLSGLGRREEALEVTREAAEVYRELAQSNPEAFWPYLAMSLNNLGNRLSDLDRREEALETMSEAVEAYRELAQGNPDAFLPDLSMSLNNLGVKLLELGRREEALAVTREAIEIRRELAKSNPHAFQPDLAKSLNNLSAILSELGRREEALEVTREAVALCRALAPRNPDALPYLAMSLNNLSATLSELGRQEESLEVTREAVELYRALAEENPDVFRPDLAYSLNKLGLRLSELDRQAEALAAVNEAVDLLWPFFERLPSDFAQNTEIMLRHLRALYEALQRPIPRVIQEHIATFERLTRF
jgi:tetratricopeptide (TPR) repeat protein/nucleoside phosphorylase